MSKQFNNKPSVLVSVPIKYKELIKTIIRLLDTDKNFESEIQSLLQSKLNDIKIQLDLLEITDKKKKVLNIKQLKEIINIL